MTESFPAPEGKSPATTSDALPDLNALRDEVLAGDRSTMSLTEAFQAHGGAEGGGFHSLHLYNEAAHPDAPADSFDVARARQLYVERQTAPQDQDE